MTHLIINIMAFFFPRADTTTVVPFESLPHQLSHSRNPSPEKQIYNALTVFTGWNSGTGRARKLFNECDGISDMILNPIKYSNSFVVVKKKKKV